VGLELVAWYKSSAVLLHQFFFIGFRSSFKSNSLPRRGKRFRMYDYYELGLQGRKYQALNRRRHRATPTAFCHVLLSSHPLAHIGLTLRNRRYGSIPSFWCNKPILLYSIIQFRSILLILLYSLNTRYFIVFYNRTKATENPQKEVTRVPLAGIPSLIRRVLEERKRDSILHAPIPNWSI